MKKILLTIAATGITAGAFAQGIVNFENNAGAQYVTLGTANGAQAAAGSYQVALLWFNGASYQQIGAVYQTSAAGGDGPGYFFGEAVTVPTFGATGTFEVEGWTGSFGSYAAAVAGEPPTGAVGLSSSFVSAEGNLGTTPKGLAANITTGAGSWTGQLILVPVPEPSTIALGGLGAAALLMFRRRK